MPRKILFDTNWIKIVKINRFFPNCQLSPTWHAFLQLNSFFLETCFVTLLTTQKSVSQPVKSYGVSRVSITEDEDPWRTSTLSALSSFFMSSITSSNITWYGRNLCKMDRRKETFQFRAMKDILILSSNQILMVWRHCAWACVMLCWSVNMISEMINMIWCDAMLSCLTATFISIFYSLGAWPAHYEDKLLISITQTTFFVVDLITEPRLFWAHDCFICCWFSVGAASVSILSMA